MSRDVLIETITPNIANVIIESAENTKSAYLSGIFMQAEITNGNNRVYPLHEISSAVNQINEQIKRGETVFGELNHPDNLSIDLNNVSHIITSMWMKGNDAYGKARIIEDHPKGQIIKAILKAGGKLGVSSRGSGSVVEGKVKGYEITTVDVVATPSAPNAKPELVLEHAMSKDKIAHLANAAIHDKAAQQYFYKEITSFFEKLTGQNLRK